ncbi:molybdate ABC transporter substrate-binding protein [bacterium]|nr:MAG: molybdate ABC transporter substrate-binding protein [bacterium]
MRFRTYLLLSSLLSLTAFTPAQAAPVKGSIVVSAAASLKDVLSALGTSFQAQHPGTKIDFNFGSSGTLRTQIEAGAPADLFVPADDKNMDSLVSQNLIDTPSRRVLAGNRLVLVVPSDSRLKIKSFRDLTRADIERVAIGATGVPAGDRAREVFTKLRVTGQIEPKAVRGKDVREVLAQVETGNVEAGIVYRTDALTSSRVKIIATAPTNLHSPIRYPGAIVKGAANHPLAAQFLAYLRSGTAKAKFKAAGFVTP